MDDRPVNECNVTEEVSWLYESLARRTMKSLARNNIPAEYARDRKEALEKVIQAIPPDSTIGIGDSVTLHQIGLFSWLEAQNKMVFNPFQRHPDGRLVFSQEERLKIMRAAMTADVFLASSNAVTMDGKLVNIDGRGNRVAPMIFGPNKVILVAGANKIVKDVEEALQRIKSFSAPVNAKRHALKHHMDYLQQLPCVATGICGECHHQAKICRKISIIDGQSPVFLSPGQEGIMVILVGEPLGL